MTYVEPDISSSYKKVPVFGQFFYDYVMEHKPKTIIEFGTRYGYSAVCMAQALRDLGQGHLYSYDDLSQAGTLQMLRIQDSISDYKLDEWITFEVKNFYEWLNNPTAFDLLHVDVDNTGEVIRLLQKKFPNQHVIFEGGIPNRDREGQLPMVGSAKYTVLVWDFPGLSKLGDKNVRRARKGKSKL